MCPQPALNAVYRSACRPDLLFAATRFISDFTVDHLFKPAPPRFQRTAGELLAPFVGATVAANEELQNYAQSLAALSFTQLDTATGVFYADIENEDRQFVSDLPGSDEIESVRIELPERLEGGYWRTPGALELAFWKGKRIGFVVDPANGDSIQGEIECFSLSADALRIELSGEQTPGIIVHLSECQ